MIRTKDKFKRQFRRVTLLAVFFAVISFSVAGLIFSTKTSVQAKIAAQTAYINQVDELAQKVNLSFDPAQMSGEADAPAVVYNFLSVVNFYGEGDLLNAQYKSTGKTNKQILEEMYNTGDYSVNKYYKVVSNGKLDLRTEIVVQNNSAQLGSGYVRNYFYNKYETIDGVYRRDSNGNRTIWENNGYDSEVPKTILGQSIDGFTEDIYRGIEFLNTGFAPVKNYIKANNLLEAADYDNDNQIDSVSVLYFSNNAQDYWVQWSDLLWSHSWKIPIDLIDYFDGLNKQYWGMLETLLKIQLENFKITHNGQTRYVGSHMVHNFNYEASAAGKTGMPANNTDIHELGHVLGWPDYYLYGNLTTSTGNPVHYWDIMGYNHGYSPQYPTTYSREKQGWLEETSIQTLTHNGQYRLQAVNYEEVHSLDYNGRVLAYKLQHPTKPSQSVYMEYRKQNANSFEDNSSVGFMDGLLVYRVDEGFGRQSDLTENFTNHGNAAAVPYNLFVFNNYSQNLKAPLNESNTSMSSVITWQNYSVIKPQEEYSENEVTFTNSGILIEFVGFDEETWEVIFKVTWSELQEEEIGEIVEQEEFVDINLYNSLLSLYGKGGKIEKDALLDEDFINLSKKGLTSIKGLELLEFKTNAVVDLSHNNLTSVQDLEELVNNYNVLFNLMLNNISYFSNSNPNFILGLQNPSSNFFVLGQFGSQTGIEIYNFDDYYSYFNLSTAHSITEGQNLFQNVQNYSISLISKNSNFQDETIEFKISSVSILNNEIVFEWGGDLELDNLFEFENANFNDFEFEIKDAMGQGTTLEALTTQIGIRQFTIEAFVSDSVVKTFSISLEVQDNIAPTISLLGESEEVFFMQQGTWVDPWVNANDNYDGANIAVYQNGSVDPTTSGVYTISYHTIDSSGNVSQTVTRTVRVMSIAPKTGIILDVFATQPNVLNMFNFTGASSNDFNIEVITAIQTNTLGNKTLKVRFTHKEKALAQLEITNTVAVVDRIKPIISISGQEVEYVYIGSSFNDQTQVVATDNFDTGNLTISRISGSVDPNTIGTYYLGFTATDTSGNISTPVYKTVHVISRPFDNLSVKKISKINKITENTRVAFEVDLSTFSSKWFNYETEFVWFVNGQEVSRANSTTFEYLFKTVGEFEVEVKAWNRMYTGNYQLSENAQVLKVNVEQGGVVEKYTLPIVGGATAFIVTILGVSMHIKKRKRLF